MENLTGTQLGDYLLQELIGAGGMGQVYRARQVHLGTAYAVKVLPEGLAGSEGFVERFRNEARVMASLRHPHIVEVHTLSEAGGRYFLAMDYIAGPRGRPRNLRNVLAESPDRRVPPDQCRQWVAQLARALAYAHSLGIVHRDIKPANVLLDADGNAMLSDFGLVEIVGEATFRSRQAGIDGSLSGADTMAGGGSPPPGADLDAAPTIPPGGRGAPTDDLDAAATQPPSTADVVGTYDFMSPEQREGRPVDQRADIYALGVLAYQLLTGRRVMGVVAPPSQILPGLDPSWDRLYHGCLAYDPADRLADAGEIADLLESPRAGGAEPPHRALQDPGGVVAEILAKVGAALDNEDYGAARTQADRLTGLGQTGDDAAEQVRSQFERLVDALCRRADAAFQANEPDQARDLAQHALALLPNSDKARECAAKAQALREELEQRETVRKILAHLRAALHDKDYAAARTQADRLVGLGQAGHDAAEQVHQDFQQVADGLCRQAAQALKASRADSACVLTQDAITLLPEHAKAREFSELAQNLRTGLDLRDRVRRCLADDDFSEAGKFVAQMLALGKIGQRLAEPFVTQLRKHARQRGESALALAERGKRSQAMVAANEALQLDPDCQLAQDVLSDMREVEARRERIKEWVGRIIAIGAALLVIFVIVSVLRWACGGCLNCIHNASQRAKQAVRQRQQGKSEKPPAKLDDSWGQAGTMLAVSRMGYRSAMAASLKVPLKSDAVAAALADRFGPVGRKGNALFLWRVGPANCGVWVRTGDGTITVASTEDLSDVHQRDRMNLARVWVGTTIAKGLPEVDSDTRRARFRETYQFYTALPKQYQRVGIPVQRTYVGGPGVDGVLSWPGAKPKWARFTMSPNSNPYARVALDQRAEWYARSLYEGWAESLMDVPFGDHKIAGNSYLQAGSELVFEAFFPTPEGVISCKPGNKKTVPHAQASLATTALVLPHFGREPSRPASPPKAGLASGQTLGLGCALEARLGIPLKLAPVLRSLATQSWQAKRAGESVYASRSRQGTVEAVWVFADGRVIAAQSQPLRDADAMRALETVQRDAVVAIAAVTADITAESAAPRLRETTEIYTPKARQAQRIYVPALAGSIATWLVDWPPARNSQVRLWCLAVAGTKQFKWSLSDQALAVKGQTVTSELEVHDAVRDGLSPGTHALQIQYVQRNQSWRPSAAYPLIVDGFFDEPGGAIGIYDESGWVHSSPVRLSHPLSSLHLPDPSAPTAGSRAR